MSGTAKPKKPLRLPGVPTRKEMYTALTILGFMCLAEKWGPDALTALLRLGGV